MIARLLNCQAILQVSKHVTGSGPCAKNICYTPRTINFCTKYSGEGRRLKFYCYLRYKTVRIRQNHLKIEQLRHLCSRYYCKVRVWHDVHHSATHYYIYLVEDFALTAPLMLAFAKNSFQKSFFGDNYGSQMPRIQNLLSILPLTYRIISLCFYMSMSKKRLHIVFAFIFTCSIFIFFIFQHSDFLFPQNETRTTWNNWCSWLLNYFIYFNNYIFNILAIINLSDAGRDEREGTVLAIQGTRLFL